LDERVVVKVEEEEEEEEEEDLRVQCSFKRMGASSVTT
jgi:hypothetical protein